MFNKIKTLTKRATAFLVDKVKYLFNLVKGAILSFSRKVAQKVLSAASLMMRKVKNFVKLNITENVKFGCALVKTFFVSLFKGGVKEVKSGIKAEVEGVVSKNPGALTRLAILSASMALVVLSSTSVWFWNLNTVAVSVNTNGVCVGYITSEKEYDNIYKGIEDMLVPEDVESYVSKVTLGYGIASKNEIKSGYEIASDVLSAQTGVKAVKGLFVNGAFVACASSEQVISSALEERINLYRDENTIKSEILDEVVIRDVFCAIRGVVSDEEAVAAIKNPKVVNLSISTVKIEEQNQPIAFKTVTTLDASKIIGYNRVKTQGKNGQSIITNKCTYVNGVAVETETISTEIVSKPTDRVIVSGTSTKGVSSVQQSLSSSGIKFLWPIAVTDRMYVSSVYGDGRNHTGIDITGYEGTDIYASLDGTVSYAGPASGYGYLVVINHKNGYQTAYGHMSAIYVKAGQTVKQGDVIAACGHTGRATGDHVHFEIRKNGKTVNPANYIGLY